MTTKNHKRGQYEPTNAEVKLLKVLLDPEVLYKTITEKCELANINRSTYYTAMSKPEFLALLNVSTLDMVKGEVNDIVKAFADQAKKGSFNHGKLLLEMTQMYAQHTTIDANVNHTITVEDVLNALEEGEEDESN